MESRNRAPTIFIAQNANGTAAEVNCQALDTAGICLSLNNFSTATHDVYSLGRSFGLVAPDISVPDRHKHAIFYTILLRTRNNRDNKRFLFHKDELSIFFLLQTSLFRFRYAKREELKEKKYKETVSA